MNEDHAATVALAIYGEPRQCRVDIIRPPTKVRDSNTIYLVDGSYILHVSPSDFPDSVKVDADAVKAMRSRLGRSARVLPPIVAEGRLSGRSFMVVPRLKPLSRKRVWGRIDKWRLAPQVVSWVRELAELAEPPSEQAAVHFMSRLSALIKMPGLSVPLIVAAQEARADLEGRKVMVGHVPMHGDLWSGNLLKTPEGRLCVIDWGGSQTRGYGIVDLIRVGESLKLPPSIMRREIAIHQTALGGVEAARTHLLAALGHYAIDLGEFPRERFVAMANGVWRLFSSLN